MPLQPTLPAEGSYTDVERHFIELSPDGLWPENQDSNFGQIRKVLTDILQECVDEIDSLGSERFLDTATRYLSLWEEMLGTPVAPVGKSDQQRRAILAPRVQYGPFTTARVNAAVEAYLGATIGEAASFGTEGISLTAGGVPLYSGLVDLEGLYYVYYNPTTYTYEVWVKNTITPDTSNMTKELLRITPAGIAFTIDNTQTSVYDYFRRIRSLQPVAYFRLPTGTDSSVYANTATVNGAPLPLASPGLLHDDVDGGSGGTQFDGVDDYLSAPDHVLYSGMTDLTAEAWIRPTALATGTGTILQHGSYIFTVEFDGKIGFGIYNGTIPAYQSVVTISPIALGLTYHVVGVKRGNTLEIWINGVKVPTTANPASVPDIVAVTVEPLTIGYWPNYGAASRFTGSMDEVALYNYSLSGEQIAENFRVGTAGTEVANYMTVNANLVTDATRAAGSHGDGR